MWKCNWRSDRLWGMEGRLSIFKLCILSIYLQNIHQSRRRHLPEIWTFLWKDRHCGLQGSYTSKNRSYTKENPVASKKMFEGTNLIIITAECKGEIS